MKNGFSFFPGDVLRTKVHEHHMALGASGDNAKAAFRQSVSHCSGILDDLLLIFLVFRF